MSEWHVDDPVWMEVYPGYALRGIIDRVGWLFVRVWYLDLDDVWKLTNVLKGSAGLIPRILVP